MVTQIHLTTKISKCFSHLSNLTDSQDRKKVWWDFFSFSNILCNNLKWGLLLPFLREMYRNIQKHTCVMLFYTSYSLMPHAIHKRCIALGINRLWLSMFVFEGSGFIIACARNCCSLCNAWYECYMSFQISLTVSFINLIVCLCLFWHPGGNLFHLRFAVCFVVQPEWKLRQNTWIGSQSYSFRCFYSWALIYVTLFPKQPPLIIWEEMVEAGVRGKWWGAYEILMRKITQGRILPARSSQVQWWR